MIELIIILLMLVKLNMFNGWLLSLWIIAIVLKSISFILDILKAMLDN